MKFLCSVGGYVLWGNMLESTRELPREAKLGAGAVAQGIKVSALCVLA